MIGSRCRSPGVSDRFGLRIKLIGALEDWSVSDSTYPGGRFGLYNFSQGPVEYSAFLARETPVECSTVDAPSVGDAGAGADPAADAGDLSRDANAE